MRIKLPKCPFCGGVPELIFKIPVFGAGGCEIKCTTCQARVNDFNYSETHFNGETLSTPITTKSVVKCIIRAVAKWNRRTVTDDG